MRIVIDHGKCIGSGNCVLAAPDVFAQSDEDGTVVVIGPAPAEYLRAAVAEAAETCPARAIAIEE